MQRSILAVGLLVLAGCGADGGSRDGEGQGQSATAGTEPTGATTNDPGSMSSTSDTGDDSEDSGQGSTSGQGTDDPTTEGGSASETGGADSTGSVIDVPDGVFLWTGAGGGGPGTDLYPDEVEKLLADAGIDVGRGETLPADFADRFGTVVYLNPIADFDPAIDAAATDLVATGGRLVLVMEHCKNGCWGNEAGHNALLESLGSSLRLRGDGGAPLSDTSLQITEVAPLTDGVTELVVYYSGHVEAGQGVALGSIAGTEAIVAWEQIGPGEVLAIADSSMFGYRMQAGDNPQFILNLAAH